MHANVCVCANISVFVFFVWVHMNNERDYLYTCLLVQNVYVCRWVNVCACASAFLWGGIYRFVCVIFFIYLWVNVCQYVCIYQISAICGSINGCALVCICMCFLVCVRRWRVYACVHAGFHVCKCSCLYIYAYVKVRTSACVCVSACV